MAYSNNLIEGVFQESTFRKMRLYLAYGDLWNYYGDSEKAHRNWELAVDSASKHIAVDEGYYAGQKVGDPVFRKFLESVRNIEDIGWDFNLGTIYDSPQSKRLNNFMQEVSEINQMEADSRKKLFSNRLSNENEFSQLAIDFSYAIALFSDNKWEDAANKLEFLIKRDQKEIGNQNFAVALMRQALGDCYVRLGQIEKAVSLFDAAMIGFQNSFGIASTLAIVCMEKKASSLELIGQTNDARKLREVSVNLLKFALDNLHSMNNNSKSEILKKLGVSQYKLGRFEDAVETYRELLRELSRNAESTPYEGKRS